MPKLAARVIRQQHVPQQQFNYTVKTVRALPREKFTDEREFNCENGRDAYQVADRLQQEFDADADPCRTYVYRGTDPVPVHAGLERSTFNGR